MSIRPPSNDEERLRRAELGISQAVPTAGKVWPQRNDFGEEIKVDGGQTHLDSDVIMASQARRVYVQDRPSRTFENMALSRAPDGGYFVTVAEENQAKVMFTGSCENCVDYITNNIAQPS